MNINSITLRKRDRYNSRHKPFEKHINMNNRQRRQLRSIRTWYKNSSVMLITNLIFKSFYGGDSFLSRQTTVQRSMSSILNCSI